MAKAGNMHKCHHMLCSSGRNDFIGDKERLLVYRFFRLGLCLSVLSTWVVPFNGGTPYQTLVNASTGTGNWFETTPKAS